MPNSDSTRPTPVSVLGLGLMGQALARAFLRAGHPTTVWNRTPAKAEPLTAVGAARAGTAAAAVAASPLVVVCVTDHDALREVLEPLGRAVDGRVLVYLGSGTASGARETAAWAAAHGAAYLDGGIMATPPAVGTEEAVVVYSGPREVFDRHEPVLRVLAGTTTHLGADHGLSSRYEAAVLSLMWNVLNGFLHGAALLTASGVDARSFAPVAARSLEMVTGWLGGFAEQIDDGAFPGEDATLTTHLAAMEHLVRESEDLGVDVRLPRFVRDIARRSVAAGRGDESYAVLIDQFRTSAGADR
ncbi:NAD(P)-dependent oxidoreductase [Streptomyces viridochromogenes]|uniref:Putative dehydrogenase n=1 Tax=Streptomyces viridochromogenes Tue57 TaxID=1160705 RepID=L8P885_STRVR|nr:NAD(P)-binding domain-containing protein [Streptomyces viridochromogenes]AUD39497.1 WHU imine reductase 12 [synthetic construct]ELS51517.1 putative dehydrogenase [Streptomyces viridochromogenes Tue57]